MEESIRGRVEKQSNRVKYKATEEEDPDGEGLHGGCWRVNHAGRWA